MRRRELMILLSGRGGCGTARWARRAARRRLPVVGFLSGTLARPRMLREWPRSIRDWAETGYVAGQNLAIEYRWGRGPL